MVLIWRLVVFVFVSGAFFAIGAEAKIDAKANEVLNALGATLVAAKSAEVELHLAVKTTNGPVAAGDLVADYLLSVERPNRMALVLKSGNLGATVVCDGTNTITFIPQ